MAIRIPILTSFDPKGLKQANASFAKLQSSVGSLGRNFAFLGAAIAGAGALIAKNVQALARIEEINAQTAQTIKSMGNASNISAAQVEALATKLEGLTATEAETIQQGANLLLTFRNISDQAGAGNDIFTQTTAIMVDMGRALKEGASASAIRLGKALNDPIRGITALRKVGVGFTEDQEAQIKALQESGDLMGAQKIILAELQAQFGGSGAAFAQTFSGQLELMGHELGTIGEEATMSVMPALQGVVEQLRELIPVIGPQLKAAIESVDFVALGKAVVGFTTFLVQNAEAIARTIAAIFIISTAYKTMAVAVGIAKVATDLYKYAVAQAAAGVTIKTVAVNLLSTAMKLIPFVAVIAGLALLLTAFTNTTKWAGKSASGVATFGDKLSFAGGKAGVLVKTLKEIPPEIKTKITISTAYDSAEARRFTELAFGRGGLDMSLGKFDKPAETPTGGGTAAKVSGLASVQQDMAKSVKLATKQGQLAGTGLSQGYIDSILGSQAPLKAANQQLTQIFKADGSIKTKVVNRLNREFSQTVGEVNRVAAEASAARASAAAEASAAFVAAQEAAANAARESRDREAAALAERKRVYESFLDSVKSTFGNIKNSILGAFDLTELGGSTNSITRNMDKLLVRLKSFAANVRNLSGMGLNPALLQQVIAAGPLAGARLAQTLVAGGANALNSINAGYAEFGSLSSQIAQTGTESMFGSQGQQNVYNINVGGGVGSGATIGKAIVDAIKDYERVSGAVWQGA